MLKYNPQQEFGFAGIAQALMCVQIVVGSVAL